MNYNYLRYFSVLAELEHYTNAAARLGISQPSLSSAIHQLESELDGVQLFEKVGRNVRLTEEGRYYYEKVEIAMQELNIEEWKNGERFTVIPNGEFELSWCLEEIPEEYLEIKRIRFTKTDSSFSFSVRQDGYERAIDMTDFEVEVVR